MISAMRHKFNPSGRVPSLQIYALFLARDMGGGRRVVVETDCFLATKCIMDSNLDSSYPAMVAEDIEFLFNDFQYFRSKEPLRAEYLP
jgi:hypothetical protein